MKRLVNLKFVCALFFAGLPAHAGELVYFNSPTCGICERWDEEVGAIYDKTDESKRLALRPQSIHDDRAPDLAFIQGVVYTPTFVFVENGQEVGRIVGYINDGFFWEQVSGLIQKADALKTPNSTACLDPEMSARPAMC